MPLHKLLYEKDSFGKDRVPSTHSIHYDSDQREEYKLHLINEREGAFLRNPDEGFISYLVQCAEMVSVVEGGGYHPGG